MSVRPANPKIIVFPGRKDCAPVRYSHRGERMAAGDGQCLALARAEAAEGQRVNAKDAAGPVREVRELFLEMRVPLCRYLVSLGLSASEAEDAAQESFLRLCERPQPLENVRGWMFRVAH